MTDGSAPIHFLGYVSALELLTKTLEDQRDLNRIPEKMKSIITMSEFLSPELKTRSRELFKCQVLSRYSNVENGIIAQQTLDDPDHFTVNTGSYYLEILELEKDIRLPHGRLGRIVITDYFNYAMPMIRYDTGDLGVIEEKEINGQVQLVLTEVQGRKLDQIYNTKGHLISSYLVYKNMWKYTEIDQYQLIQKDKKEFLIKICTKAKFGKEMELTKEFLSYLGEDAVFNIEYVDEIPLLSSGKRRKVVNLMSSI